MKYLKVLLIICTSFFVSLIFLLISVNFYLKWGGKAKESLGLKWTLLNAHYSSKYIFWDKSHCEKFPYGCYYPEEQYVSYPVEVFKPTNTERCTEYTRILFLGDSFTVAYWTNIGESYPSIFSKKLADYQNRCVYQMRLASGGTGTDQQFAIFLDLMDKLNPDIVVWQFYYNDLHENVKQALYDPDNQRLRKRSTLNNMTFLAGYLNQNVPLLSSSTLGKHLMYLGESKDVLRNWPVSTDNQKITFTEYNKEKISLILDKMSEVAKANNFALYTTLASFECQIFPTINRCWSINALNNMLIGILKEHSDYIAMDQFQKISKNVLGVTNYSSVPGSQDYPFETEKDVNPVGERHFSVAGNNEFGSILFDNFRQNNIY